LWPVEAWRGKRFFSGLVHLRRLSVVGVLLHPRATPHHLFMGLIVPDVDGGVLPEFLSGVGVVGRRMYQVRFWILMN
jgi:hypothetical protein